MTPRLRLFNRELDNLLYYLKVTSEFQKIYKIIIMGIDNTFNYNDIKDSFIPYITLLSEEYDIHNIIFRLNNHPDEIFNIVTLYLIGFLILKIFQVLL